MPVTEADTEMQQQALQELLNLVFPPVPAQVRSARRSPRCLGLMGHALSCVPCLALHNLRHPA